MNRALFSVLAVLTLFWAFMPTASFVPARAVTESFKSDQSGNPGVTNLIGSVDIGFIYVYLGHQWNGAYTKINVKAYDSVEGAVSGTPPSYWVELRTNVTFWDNTELWGGDFEAVMYVYKLKSGGNPNNEADYVKQPTQNSQKMKWNSGTGAYKGKNIGWLIYHEDFTSGPGPEYYRCELTGRFNKEHTTRNTKYFYRINFPPWDYYQNIASYTLPSQPRLSKLNQQHPFDINGTLSVNPTSGSKSNTWVDVEVKLANGEPFSAHVQTDSTGFFDATFVLCPQEKFGWGWATVKIQDQPHTAGTYKASGGVETDMYVYPLAAGSGWFEVNKRVDEPPEIARWGNTYLYALVSSYDRTGNLNLQVLDMPSGMNVVFDPTVGFTEVNTTAIVPLRFYANDTVPGDYEITLLVSDGADMDNCSFVLTVFDPLVGGFNVPIDKLDLLYPYIILTSVTLAATTSVTAYIRHLKNRKRNR